MRKKDFLNFDKENVYCECCKRTLPTKYFSYSYIRKNGTSLRCKYCDWFYRHDDILNASDYSKETIESIVEFFIFEKSIYVNDLLDTMDVSFKDLINILRILKINNKKMLIKISCKKCGKIVARNLSAYHEDKNTYCSYECYWKDKTNTVGTGELNLCYNRIVTNCTNCGKEIRVTPYNYNTENSWGDNHNFCSQKCYWEFRKKYYVAEKSISRNRVITDEQREKMRLRILNNSRNSNRFNTKIQLKTNKLLDDNNIKYNREYIIKYYAVDNYLIDYNLIIEVMGDFWHVSPLKYNKSKYPITELQQRTLLKDRQKKSYILNYCGINILYLWEYDIENRIDVCEKLIHKYIDSGGVLDDYNSFNWSSDDKTQNIQLNDNIIVPYQDMQTDEYRHLIKTKAS